MIKSLMNRRDFFGGKSGFGIHFLRMFFSVFTFDTPEGIPLSEMINRQSVRDAVKPGTDLIWILQSLYLPKGANPDELKYIPGGVLIADHLRNKIGQWSFELSNQLTKRQRFSELTSQSQPCIASFSLLSVHLPVSRS